MCIIRCNGAGRVMVAECANSLPCRRAHPLPQLTTFHGNRFVSDANHLFTCPNQCQLILRSECQPDEPSVFLARRGEDAGHAKNSYWIPGLHDSNQRVVIYGNVSGCYIIYGNVWRPLIAPTAAPILHSSNQITTGAECTSPTYWAWPGVREFRQNMMADSYATVRANSRQMYT
jgi:hypothetical protein